ncbi:MAG: hypothetical protein AABZ74_03790 [Cyanobacteriota bacterium]
MELTNENIDNYFLLIKNLNNKTKLKLISKISNSILEIKTNDDTVMSCFGRFDSAESADEIIDNIYKSRNFEPRDISL